MNPYLTNSGRALLVASILFLAAGTVSGLWAMLLIGLVLAAILGLAYQSLLPSALVLERRLLSVQVAEVDRSVQGTLHTGKPVTLRLKIQNRAGAALRGMTLDAHTSSGLETVEAAPAGVRLPGYSYVVVDMGLRAKETGRWFLHGFKVTIEDALGLVAVGEYVGTPTAFKFLPEVLRTSRRAPRFDRRRARDREGEHFVRQPGFGSDLRELRDHQSGDPFRSIAWKATARTGRLMVKDYESELMFGAYLCLDVSSTMRGGGQELSRSVTKIEHALQLSAAYAQKVSARHDRLGLITFDEKIHGHIQPREGKFHLRKVLDHLMGVRHIVDDDLTEYTDLEVAELVGKYLLVQERLDFRRASVVRKSGEVQRSFVKELLDDDGETFDIDLLQRWVASVIDAEEERFGDPCLSAGVLSHPKLSGLRRFCHLRGVEIPYRVETRLGQKERGLVQCLEEIMSQTRDGHFVLVVTDLCGIMNTELIVRGLRLIQSRRHRVAFVVPFTPEYVQIKPRRGKARSERLHRLFSQAESEERAVIIDAIRALGVPVVRIGPTASLDEVMRKVGRLSMRRR